MMKFLIFGTLIMGSLVLLSNMMPAYRHHHRSRRQSGRKTNPLAAVAAFTGREDAPRRPGGELPGTGKIRKTEQEWRAELTDEQFRVTRRGETERPFTGRYWNHREEGTYRCAGCGRDLFSSEAKYDAGTGWPSFRRPVGGGAVGEIPDISYGIVRTEIVCRRCEAHLGHVFADGPPPTGLRYCINSAALDFAAAGTGTDGESPSAGDRMASGQ